MGTFWRVVKLTFHSIIFLIWFCILFTFVYIPYFIFLSFKRIHVKNKVRRSLVKKGLPRDLARKMSREYKGFLVQYGTMRGIFRSAHDIRKKIKNPTAEEIKEITS